MTRVKTLKNQYGECDFWTIEEDDILRLLYPIATKEEIKNALPNRTWQAIVSRAIKELKLHRTKKAISKALSISLKGVNKGNKRPDLVEYNRTHDRYGANNPFYGKTHTKETRKIISESQKKKSAFHKLNKDPEFQKKRHKALAIKPTIPEKLLKKSIKHNNLPFKYVGDGNFVVGVLNPDFIRIDNGIKQIIEVFGDYWHDDEQIEVPWYRTEFGRKAYFSQLGYDCLIIWEHEIKEDMREVIKKIEKYMGD